MIMGRSTIILVLLFWSLPVTAEVLSRPAGLEPDIAFWRRVFSEVTSDQALIHDNRELGIVYEKVDLPAGASARDRRKISDGARKRYRRILNDLADGKAPTGLTFEERRVLSLFPGDVGAEQLRSAAGRIRFQQGLADRFREGYIRAGLWQDFIRENLADAGVPQSLASLPHVESSFNPKARSYVGASGLWQFTRSTGRRFMQIDHVVDERRDPFMSSVAAARLLQYNYSILNSWPLAITAYNHGVAGMRRAVKKMGTDDIEAIIRGYDGRSFGFASRNFYVAFLAANEVDEKAKKYFGKLTREKPRPEIVVKLSDYMAVDTLSGAFGVPLETLQDRNPALLPSVWSGTKFVPRGFELRLPDDGADFEPMAVLAAIPADRKFAMQTPDLQHRVERGESLSGIAARYRTSVSVLMSLNNLRSRNRIYIGQVLNLPYRGNASLASIPKGTDTYVVQRGDTVAVIAQRAGMGVDELLAMNSLRNKHRIYPGQQLMLVAAPTESAGPGVKLAVAQVSVAEEPVIEKPSIEKPIVEVSVAELTVAKPLIIEEVAPETSEPELSETGATIRIAARSELRPVAGDIEIPSLVVASDTMDMVSQPMATASEPSEGEADVVGKPAEQGEPAELLADPSDYAVSDAGTIEVQAAETLGHYADWLGIRTQRLRDLNDYSFRRPVVIGQRMKLDFSVIYPDEFTKRRVRYHRELQEAFFTRYRIADTKEHLLKEGESLYILTVRRYKVPIWLLRQYNPDLDLNRARYGTKIVFPQIERVIEAEDPAPEMVDAT
jgi:membrane-bound lytic murein transglycosylase D